MNCAGRRTECVVEALSLCLRWPALVSSLRRAGFFEPSGGPTSSMQQHACTPIRHNEEMYENKNRSTIEGDVMKQPGVGQRGKRI